MTRPGPKYCSLELALGHAEPCAHGACAFWEPGGAVVEPGCAVERLGLASDLDSRPALADNLLELRARLEDVADASAEAEARAGLYGLVSAA